MPAFITHHIFGQELLADMRSSLFAAPAWPPSGQNSRYCAAGEPPSGQNSRYCAVCESIFEQRLPQTAQYLEFCPLGGSPAAQYLEFCPLGGHAGAPQAPETPRAPAASNAQAAAQRHAAADALFLLGNQGPDPFFFALRTARLVALKRFGSSLHSERVREAIQAMLDFAARANAADQSLLGAYIAGYLGHYSLDSLAHPLVYAQQYAICQAGVPGLSEADGSVVHGQIEADLDAMMLYRCRAQTVRDFKPARMILPYDANILAIVDAMYRHVALEVYGVRLQQAAFSRSVADMRLTLHLLYSPRSAKRDALGKLERIARRHSLLQAMSTPVTASAVCDFDNHERQPWQDPFTGETSTASFTQLFSSALELASQRISQLAGAHAACSLNISKSFDGKPL